MERLIGRRCRGRCASKDSNAVGGGEGFCLKLIISHLSFSFFFCRKLLSKARHIFPAISLNGTSFYTLLKGLDKESVFGTSFYTLLKGHDKENVFLVICI